MSNIESLGGLLDSVVDGCHLVPEEPKVIHVKNWKHKSIAVLISQSRTLQLIHYKMKSEENQVNEDWLGSDCTIGQHEATVKVLVKVHGKLTPFQLWRNSSIRNQRVLIQHIQSEILVPIRSNGRARSRRLMSILK